MIIGCGFQYFAQSYNNYTDTAADSVVTILTADGGQAKAVGSGLIVRSDGYILTPYHLVKGAQDIQIRLRNGETFDKAEIVSTDERRNVALLRIKAAGLKVIPGTGTEENQVGSNIVVVANSGNGQILINKDKLLNAVGLADMIQGAGKGFRVLQFDKLTENAAGALVLDESGRSLGIVTTTPEIKDQNIAVPLSSVLGLINAVPVNNSSTTSSVYISSSSLSQKASSPSTQTKKVFSQNPRELLANAKTVSVNSRTTFFKEHQLINELLKRNTIKQWGWLFLDGNGYGTDNNPDLIIELDHQILTFNFTFTVRHRETSIVLASGKVIISDGGSGSNFMADRIIEKLSAVLKPAPNTAKDKTTD